jgi:uncharacterized membrane protein
MRVKISDNTAINARISQSSESSELLPEMAIKNIQAIADRQEQHLQNLSAHQLVLDKITAVFSRSEFLYFQIIFFITWWLSSYLSNRHILPVDFPVFDL